MTTPAQLAAELVANPYAWPGGYPRFAITADGAALCWRCCESNGPEIAASEDPRDGGHVVALDINWEDSALVCDDCGAFIESAYGEPN
jgi:hypothetical protein